VHGRADTNAKLLDKLKGREAHRAFRALSGLSPSRTPRLARLYPCIPARAAAGRLVRNGLAGRQDGRDGGTVEEARGIRRQEIQEVLRQVPVTIRTHNLY
jgi:hypothetical protein